MVNETVQQFFKEEYARDAGITYERVPELELTDQDRADIREALRDLATGNYSGPFSTDKEIEDHFASLKS